MNGFHDLIDDVELLPDSRGAEQRYVDNSFE